MKMKIYIIISFIIIILSGCFNQETKQHLDFLTGETHIRYIIEQYSFGDNSDYIKNHVENTYVTNEFIINSLADTFSFVKSIENINNEEYKVVVNNDIELYIKLILNENMIKKITVKIINEKNNRSS